MSDDTQQRKSSQIPLKILDSGYTLVPAYWTKLILEGTDKGIPASFWKFMLVLWKEIVGFNCAEKGFVAKKTMNDFGMRPATAMKWTAACASSCLFKVDYGYRHNIDKPGIPTRFRYLDGTQQDWEVFIDCVATTLRRDKSASNSPDDVVGFRLALTEIIFRERRRIGLSPAITEDSRSWLSHCEKQGLISVVQTNPVVFEIVRKQNVNRVASLKPGEYVSE